MSLLKVEAVTYKADFGTIVSYNGPNEEDVGLFENYFHNDFLWLYAASLIPMAIVFICCLPSYLKAYKRNLPAYEEDPNLLPLITNTFQNLRVNYPILIVSFLASIPFIGYEESSFHWSLTRFTNWVGSAVSFVAFIYCTSVLWLSSSYQLTISILSIQRCIRRRQPNIRFSRKELHVLMLTVLTFIVSADFIWAVVTWLIWVGQQYGHVMISVMVYQVLYSCFQFVIFIGMGLQHAMNSEPGNSHSENMIAAHTKTIGIVKLGLFILAVFCRLTNLLPALGWSMFFLSDFFMVPVAIQLTEIRANPNLLKTREVKKEPLTV